MIIFALIMTLTPIRNSAIVGFKGKVLHSNIYAFRTLEKCIDRKNSFESTSSDLTVQNNIIYKMTFECKQIK